MSKRPIRAPRCPIDIFDYRDYRVFLADYYQRRKARGFSYRAFSRVAQLGAPNYLKLVIMGKRNLTPRMAARFAAACGLHGDAATYFEQLVAYNQASSAQEQQECAAVLSVCREYREARILEQGDATILSSGADMRGSRLATYHSEMMRRAELAMKLLPAEQRDISSLTFCLSAKGVARLKARIQVFRRELIEFAEKECEREQVVQLNLQLFPLSVPDTARSSVTTIQRSSLQA